MKSNFIYLDLETTGLDPKAEDILEIAILTDEGKVLINSLVKPTKCNSWPNAQLVNSISPEMVKSAPYLHQLKPIIKSALAHKHVVIYNASFDSAFLKGYIEGADKIICCCNAWRDFKKEFDPVIGEYKRDKLEDVIKLINYIPPSKAHRALSDCYSCRAVWHYITHNK